jgi:hypothetical protein
MAVPKPRRRFAPVAICAARARPRAAATARAALACLAVVVAVASSALAGNRIRVEDAGDGLSYPLPTASRGSVAPLPAEARERIRRESAEGSLPGLASWLAHLAYQESIPYSRIGEARADPFAPASLPASGGGESRIEFGDDWARSAYRAMPARSLEAMLASQGSAVLGTAGGPAAPRPRNALPLAPMRGLLYILLLIAPLARIAASISFARGASSRELRQEA